MTLHKLLNKGYASEETAKRALDKMISGNYLGDTGRFFVVAQDGKYHMACCVYQHMTAYIRPIADKGITILGMC